MSSIGGVGGARGGYDIDPDGADATAGTGASGGAGSASGTAGTARTSGATATTRTGTSTGAAATSALAKVEVGKLADGSTITFDPSSGKFGGKTASGTALTSSAALYKAAQLVAEGQTTLLAGMGAPARLKLTQTLESAFNAGASTTGTPRTADQQSRSGAATISLALARTLPEGDAVKGRLVTAYAAQMAKEPLKGLKASMALNLEAAVKEGKVKLSSPQTSALAAAKESTLPSKPPYDGWFKDGKTDLNVKQYIHPEFYDAMLSGYKRQGFKTDQDLGDGRLKMSKTYTDPSTGKTTKVNVDVIKTFAEGHKPEKRLFDDMSDAKTDIEFYTGHSNLGGNVLGALAAGPKAQSGDKWIFNWMCRGKQVLADVYNRFPDAHYTTTTDPAYVVHSDKFVNGMFQGIAERKGYDEIWTKMGDTRLGWKPSVNLKDWFMKPNDPRILEVRDLDRDGRVDLSKLSGVDPLYNVGLKRVSDTSRDLKPDRVTTNPSDLPGDKVMRGVNFLNTVLTYHLDEEEHPGGNDGRLPKGVGDKIYAGGWYKSEGSELVKVEKKTVDGKAVYEVKLNSKFANQDDDALGPAIAYEVNKFLAIEKNGAYTEQDKLRGILLGSEYLAYMGESYEEVTDVVDAMRERYGFSDKLTWENLMGAIEADNLGYVSPDATKELKRRIGAVDPRNG